MIYLKIILFFNSTWVIQLEYFYIFVSIYAISNFLYNVILLFAK